MPSHMRTNTHTHTYARTHTHTFTYAHAHTHTLSPPPLPQGCPIHTNTSSRALIALLWVKKHFDASVSAANDNLVDLQMPQHPRHTTRSHANLMVVGNGAGTCVCLSVSLCLHLCVCVSRYGCLRVSLCDVAGHNATSTKTKLPPPHTHTHTANGCR